MPGWVDVGRSGKAPLFLKFHFISCVVGRVGGAVGRDPGDAGRGRRVVAADPAESVEGR